MKKEAYKIIKIPLDIKDIADFRIYRQALIDFKELEKKSKKIAKNIVKTHFLFDMDELEEKFTKEMLFEYLINFVM